MSAKSRPTITITREEVRPRGMPEYRFAWNYVYRIVNVEKPHSRLKLAIAEARRRWPGCKIKRAWTGK